MSPSVSNGTPEFPKLTAQSGAELNMGDASTLQAFIRYGKRRFPAKRYALFLVSHGEGMRCCPDKTSDGDELFTAEFSAGLTEAESVDLLIIDACLMAGVENAYQWRRDEGRFGVDYLIAAAAVSSSLPYADIFTRLRTPTGSGAPSGDDAQRTAIPPKDLGPRRFATLLVEELNQQIREGRSGDKGLERDLQSWGAFDTSKIAKAKQSLDKLATLLFEENAKAVTMTIRGKGLEAETFLYVWPERGSNVSMPHADFCHLCERIAASDKFSAEVRALAAETAEAAAAIVVQSCGFDHYKGFDSERHGLYLVFPDGDEKTRGGRTYWERTDWYTPLAIKGNDGYGRYAWCLDGAKAGNGKVENWFELMDAWFDKDDASGGSNGYDY